MVVCEAEAEKGLPSGGRGIPLTALTGLVSERVKHSSRIPGGRKSTSTTEQTNSLFSRFDR